MVVPTLLLAIPLLSCVAAGSILRGRSPAPKPSVTPGSAAHVGRSTPKVSGTIVQLFEWPWDSVAAECTSFLGPAGYGYAQVSPASEHIQGEQWWTDYQPVSYILTSKRGNRTQFINMVSTCANAGVGILVDVVTNHMTAGGGTGFGGSTYSKYNYPAVPYDESNFHYCDGSNAEDVVDYNNATNVRFCELVSLSDLAQEQSGVQEPVIAYLNDLVSLGVAGFRVDAAKHMEPSVLGSNIFSGVNGSPYFTQEVTVGGASDPSQYVGNGDVIAFGATQFAMAAFLGTSGSVSNLVTPVPMGTAWDLIDSSSANYIMANQDTERTGSSLTASAANNAYTLSAIFMLGFNYGTPTVYSGYNFSDIDIGAPQDSAGYTNQITCFSDGFRCEHRWTSIANMVQFRTAVGSADLTNVVAGTAQQVAFGRGSAGFLVINNDGGAWSQTFSTSLPSGTYCDIIHDTDADPKTCSGTTYDVASDGTFTATVGAYDALALYSAST